MYTSLSKNIETTVVLILSCHHFYTFQKLLIIIIIILRNGKENQKAGLIAGQKQKTIKVRILNNHYYVPKL